MIAKNSPKAWLLASRPKTLTAALAPVLIAATLAFTDGRMAGAAQPIPDFSCLTALLCLLFAALMQVAANLINDYFDFKKGTDGEDRLGPERACAQGWVSSQAMKWGIGIVLAMASAAGLGILASAMNAFDSTFCTFNVTFLISLGLACIVFAFLYTTLLSYCGGGDVLVWVFFGLVPVLGTYYVLTGAVTQQACLLAVATGLVTDTLLVLNNYRDRDTDRAAGKRTLIVVLGEKFGEQFYLWQGIVGVGLSAWALGLSTLLPYTIYIAMHLQTFAHMKRIKSGRALNGILGRTALNILVFALCTLFAIYLKQ